MLIPLPSTWEELNKEALLQPSVPSLSQSFGAHTFWPIMEPWHHHPSELGMRAWDSLAVANNRQSDQSGAGTSVLITNFPNPPCHAHQLLSSKRQRTTYYLKTPLQLLYTATPLQTPVLAMQPGSFLYQ